MGKKYNFDQAIWIAWERHRRTLELCKYFEIPLFILTSTKPRPIKYPILVSKTFVKLCKKKPNLIFVQCPSLVLALLCILLRKIYKYKVIVDAHNACVNPEGVLSRTRLRLLRFIHQSCDLLIVTNEGLKKNIKRYQAKVAILPDRIPNMNINNKVTRKQNDIPFRIVYICTFAEDEPYEIFFKAIEQLGTDVKAYVTGRYQNETLKKYGSSKQLVFTGFLPEKNYWELLSSADLIVDLTHREDCLLCGAYEAVALGVPLLLSDTPALRRYFRRGVIFSPNDPQKIAQSIKFVMRDYDSFRAGIKRLKEELETVWLQNAEQFLHTIKRKELQELEEPK